MRAFLLLFCIFLLSPAGFSAPLLKSVDGKKLGEKLAKQAIYNRLMVDNSVLNSSMGNFIVVPDTKMIWGENINPNTRDANGFTLLHHAVIQEDPMSAKRLLDNGANPNAKTKDGFTALHLIFIGGSERLSKEKRKIMRYLLDNGAKINAKDAEGWTAFHWATQFGHKSEMETLIKAGADPNIKNKNGITTWFLVPNSLITVKEFLDITWLEIDPNVKNKFGWTPVHVSAQNHDLKKLKYFIEEKGADPNMKGRIDSEFGGQTLLHLAVLGPEDKKPKDLIPYLLRMGANPDIKDNGGYTSLAEAAAKLHFREAQILLKAGANNRIKTIEGETPWDLAQQSLKKEGLEELLPGLAPQDKCKKVFQKKNPKKKAG